MTAPRPLALADTQAQAGFDHIDPITQYFNGNTASAMLATGVLDDSHYGADHRNSGAGGFSFRAVSGDGTHEVHVDNTSVTVVGSTAFASGIVSFASAVSVAGALTVTGIGSFAAAVTGANFVSTTTGGAAFVASNTTQCTNFNAQYVGGQTVGNLSLVGHTHAYLPLSGGTVAGPLVVTSNVTIQQTLSVSNGATVAGSFVLTSSGGGLGFFGSTPNTRQNITGSRGGNAALASLLSGLANYGLVTDSTSA
jgi:hypothetical protein